MDTIAALYLCKTDTLFEAIAFGELSKPARSEIIAVSKADGKALHSKYSSISVEELAVEIAVIRSLDSRSTLVPID